MGSSLETQISYVVETIKIKEVLGKDASLEKSLVKEWRKYLPGGSKYNVWLEYVGRPLESNAKTTTDKSGGL